MSYSETKVESFGGLNLTDDPSSVGWTGAVDLLNVDFDRRGRVHTRMGTTKLNAVAASANLNSAVGVLPGSTAATTYILSGRGANDLVAYDATGTVKASGVGLGLPIQYAALGTGTTGPYLYISTGTTIRRFDGAAFSTPAGMPSTYSLAVTATSNRLVAGDTTNRSRVKFSDAGAPETWGASNFVDLHPNDGQVVSGLASWRDLTFAFKFNKFFVFYGESTDASGNPIFNYRTVDAGQGLDGRHINAIPVCAAPDGLYFGNTAGIWRTTGGDPVKVSGALDPLFREDSTPFFTGFTGFPEAVSLAYLDGKIIVFVGNAGDQGYLVYTIATGDWTLWKNATAGNFSFFTVATIGNTSRLVYVGGDTYFRYFDPTATDDDGTAITSRYRSGFTDLGTADRKTIREWALQGSGSPTFKTATDFGSLSTGSTATLGTAPVIDEARDRTAVRGRQFGWQVSGTSRWSLNNLVAHTREKRSPGTDD